MERFLVTTAQSNARPLRNFKVGLEELASRQGRHIQYIPTFGKDSSERTIHPFLSSYQQIDDTFHYNRSLKVQRRRIRPQMVDPATGLTHMARSGKSVVFESPQIRVKSIATNSLKYPKFIMTTGAITEPNYANTDDSAAERQRLGLIARDNHQFGALLVDVLSPTKYFVRHVRADSKGRFCDGNLLYDGADVRYQQPEGMVLADYHNGTNVKSHVDATKRLLRQLKPRKLVLHDFTDMHSINPHQKDELIYQQIREGVRKDKLDLTSELYSAGVELHELAQLCEHVVIVPSNHNEFLNRWLDTGAFVKDPKNAYMGFQLAAKYADGMNPVEEGIRMAYGSIDDNVIFLENNNNFQIKGYDCGQHGHRGRNGSRGSIKQNEEMYGKSITGHCHSWEEYHLNRQVGAMQPRDIFYSKGAPSSMSCVHIGIDSLGLTQAYSIIDGKYMELT